MVPRWRESCLFRLEWVTGTRRLHVVLWQSAEWHDSAVVITWSCQFLLVMELVFLLQVDPKFLKNLKFSRKHNKKAVKTAEWINGNMRMFWCNLCSSLSCSCHVFLQQNKSLLTRDAQNLCHKSRERNWECVGVLVWHQPKIFVCVFYILSFS